MIVSECSEFEDSGSEYNPETASMGSSSSSGNIEDNSEELQRTLLEEASNHKGRPKQGRKRKFPGQTSKSRKKLKDGNKKHYTVKGKLVQPKECIDFQCNCTLKCNEIVSFQEREHFFQQFWGLESYNAQTGFIAATVKSHKVKRKRNKNSNRRQNTRVYKINNQTVCRNMYIQILRISPKRVNTAVKN